MSPAPSLTSVLAVLCAPCLGTRRRSRPLHDGDDAADERTPLVAAPASVAPLPPAAATASKLESSLFAQPRPPARHEKELLCGILDPSHTPLLPVPRASRDHLARNLSSGNSLSASAARGYARSRLAKSPDPSSRSAVMSSASSSADDLSRSKPAPRSASPSRNRGAGPRRVSPHTLSPRTSMSRLNTRLTPLSSRTHDGLAPAFAPVRAIKLTSGAPLNVAVTSPALVGSASTTLVQGTQPPSTHRSLSLHRNPSDSLSASSAAAARASVVRPEHPLKPDKLVRLYTKSPAPSPGPSRRPSFDPIVEPSSPTTPNGSTQPHSTPSPHSSPPLVAPEELPLEVKGDTDLKWTMVDPPRVHCANPRDVPSPPFAPAADQKAPTSPIPTVHHEVLKLDNVRLVGSWDE